jgi:hypothetical protein
MSLAGPLHESAARRALLGPLHQSAARLTLLGPLRYPPVLPRPKVDLRLLHHAVELLLWDA